MRATWCILPIIFTASCISANNRAEIGEDKCHPLAADKAAPYKKIADEHLKKLNLPLERAQYIDATECLDDVNLFYAPNTQAGLWFVRVNKKTLEAILEPEG